jgi:hypothetical protein
MQKCSKSLLRQELDREQNTEMFFFVPSYDSTRRHKPKEQHRQPHRCDSLISHIASYKVPSTVLLNISLVNRPVGKAKEALRHGGGDLDENRITS